MRAWRHEARRGPLLRALALLALLPRAASASAPAATVARPCTANPLCVCRGDHFACDNVPFHRFPETEAGVRHVAVSAARLGALAEAALDARPLRTLVLVDCALHHVDARALASMTASLASLDLSYNEFTEVPGAALRLLKGLNWLNLQNNHISELDPEMQWGGLGESLSTLSLSNNALDTLPAGALAALRRLARLELDGNRLRVLAPGALPGALALLRLADNLLPAPPCRALRLLPRLRHLGLRNNLLRAAACVPARLDALDLSHNELSNDLRLQLPAGPHLKRLILDLNDFTSVPSFVLDCGHLEQLSMAHNDLKHISDAAVHALARSLERLDLDHNELAALPARLRDLAGLSRLSLAYNLLEDVAELPPNLRYLSLAGNFLATFPTGLRHLNPMSLKYLDLGYNRISHVAAEHFSAWAGALATLSLRGNRLAQLSLGSFPPLRLRELVLSFNDLYGVEAGVFSNLTELRVLELSAALPGGMLPRGAPAVTWLNLDNNNIHLVSSNDLLGYPALEYLNLDFNKLIEFPSETSSSNVSYRLKELRLSYNYISKINSVFLEEVPELQSVDLSYNRMQNISQRGFYNLGNLVYLNLAGNVVELIADEAFVDLPKLEVLNLQENNLAELSTRCLSNVSNEGTNFAVNVSYNRLTTLSGGKLVSINVLDLSHNLLQSISRDFFDSVGQHVRQIFLSHNKLLLIDTSVFGTLPNLNVLNLHKNNISMVKRRAFSEMPSLQMVDLSDNHIEQLAPEQFHGLRRLRQLRLARNGLRALPGDVFQNTLLEDLDLSGNHLALFPASALARVGFTLRRLQLARNRIEHLDAAMLRAPAFLSELGLARNALSVLPDHTLAGVPRLRRLDLAHNALKANFKELFRHVPRLRHLSLEGAGLRAVPPLPLGNLTELSLRGNAISAFGAADVRWLRDLRALDLAGNRLTSLRPTMWEALPHLMSLDVSRNPIARLQHGCFDGLGRLLRLRMDELDHLEAVEPSTFRALASLRSLALESPAARGAELPLAEMVSAAPQLEALALRVRRARLDTQLLRLRAPKLRVLELRGGALAHVAAPALAALGRQRALLLRVAGTRVATLPPGLLAPLATVPQLALELAHNRLVGLEPAALYANLSDWHRLATKLLPGGLLLRGNPLRCGCAGAWAARWLRRWSSEVGGGSGAAREAARRSDCAAADARPRPLLLLGDEVECGARALSGRAPRPRCPALPALALLLLVAS